MFFRDLDEAIAIAVSRINGGQEIMLTRFNNTKFYTGSKTWGYYIGIHVLSTPKLPFGNTMPRWFKSLPLGCP